MSAMAVAMLLEEGGSLKNQFVLFQPLCISS
jgi:hypothetical protein